MGKASSNRDWSQMFVIYGIDQWPTLLFLFAHAIFLSFLSVLLFCYFTPICAYFETILTSATGARFAAGFAGAFMVLSAVCSFFAAANFFYSSLPLQAYMAQRIVGSVGDWSTVRNALDLGCGRGILLNAVAMQLKKTRSSGRVVGLTQCKRTALSTLRTAICEGVQEYVTCREGDARTLPFPDNYFDVVVSAAFVHTIGKKYGHRTVEAAAERLRVVEQLVRVLKPNGVAVMWDLLHVSEYMKRLQELRMEDIRLSERVTAFMVSSHIVSFRKPAQHVVGREEVRLQWRC